MKLVWLEDVEIIVEGCAEHLNKKLYIDIGVMLTNKEGLPNKVSNDRIVIEDDEIAYIYQPFTFYKVFSAPEGEYGWVISFPAGYMRTLLGEYISEVR